MIRVAYYIPFMGVGGTEQMVLQLCRFRDAAQFDCTVAAPEEGTIADEIRSLGVPVYTGPNALWEAASGADLINLHWLAHDAWLLSMVERIGLPFVTTLQGYSRLPALPALTICASEYTLGIQPHPERCVMIRNGVDMTRFAPRRKTPREEIILTRVCRPPKCALYFWDAMEQVLERYPQTRLRIVGNPEPCQSGSDRIQFLGIRRDIPEILADADIFVYTPYPKTGCHDLVVMEAAAAGLPCVVSSVNAVRESVVEGRNGFLTPYGDVEAVVARVGMLVQDGVLRAKMSSEAVKLARERFDMVDVTRRYEVVYRTVLQSYRDRLWNLRQEDHSQSPLQY